MSYFLSLKKAKFKIVILLIIIFVHTLWLLKAENYVTPELIFPVWLLTYSKTVVSEILSFYPPILFHLVATINKLTNNVLVSVYLVQLTIIAITDSVLFYYLSGKFKLKFVLIGFLFYVPLQVFFRGNYLWFDIGTVPFLLLSFMYFERYIQSHRAKDLIYSSAFLSLGYFFKITVYFTYFLYLFWLVYLSRKNKKLKELFRNVLFLFTPLFIIGTINFLISLQNKTLEFVSYWHILMQNIIYPRMLTHPRSIKTEYYLPMILVITIFMVCSIFIEKFSKISRNHKLFLYLFILVSIINIFPRWSDFRVQPFLLFLTIAFVYSFSLKDKLRTRPKAFFNLFLLVTIFLISSIVGNRIISEIKNKDNAPKYYISNYAPTEYNNLIFNKKIFVYDFALYNGNPMQIPNDISFFEKVNLAIGNPDKYYRVSNWQIALNYVSAKNPDIIIVPYQINNRIITDINITDFEKFISARYQKEAVIDNTYFLYSRKY